MGKRKKKKKFPHYACRIINILAPLGKTFEPLMACDAFYGFPMRTHMALLRRGHFMELCI